MTLFADIYRNKRVLITGHTGFKGSWLALWLNELGARVDGIALPAPTSPNHWQQIAIDINEQTLDIRDAAAVKVFLQQNKPDIVFHLAAQSLVRESYANPLDTWSTNVMGTTNLLEACRQCDSIRAVIVITTDKCYQNNEWPWGYRENDRLGGHDPYSASKAACEFVVSSYRHSYFHHLDSLLLATARAGNVIGGGDWSRDRLIPDMVNAVSKHQALLVRYPKATRPWQHVLDSLSGYLVLGQHLLQGNREFADAWNFGPHLDSNCTVESVLTKISAYWPTMHWTTDSNNQLHEAHFLYLDSTKARRYLEWSPIWTLDTTLANTAAWYQQWIEKNRVISHQQLADYVSDAIKAEASWTK